MEFASALFALRDATGAAHRGLDTGLDIDARLAAPESRLELIRGYHAMHAAAEAAFVPLLRGVGGLDLPERCRAPRLRAELDSLGAHPRTIPHFGLDGWAQALGALYVMEGSSLGGRVILRNLAASGVCSAELGFMDPYGPWAGVMWRLLAEVLERELRDALPRAAAILGARAAFAHAQFCLQATQVSAGFEQA